MVHRLRASLLLLAAATTLVLAAPAAAQDSEPDHYGDQMRELQAVRIKQLRQVNTAPYKAMHGWRDTDIAGEIGDGSVAPSKRRKVVSEDEDPGPKRWPLYLAIGLVVGSAGFFFTRKLAQR